MVLSSLSLPMLRLLSPSLSFTCLTSHSVSELNCLCLCVERRNANICVRSINRDFYHCVYHLAIDVAFHPYLMRMVFLLDSLSLLWANSNSDSLFLLSLSAESSHLL